MRCVVWAAVSSRPQANDKESIPDQIAKARQHIANREGWREVHDPLVVTHSRDYIFLADAARDMPEYRQVMDLAREGKFDLLICRSRDRLGRRDSLISVLEEYLSYHGVQVLSLAMPSLVVDPKEYAHTKDRTGVWLRSVERAAAQSEIIELTARHRFGMIRRIKEGRHANTPPFGYRKDGDLAVVHEAEAELVRLAYRWYLEGASMKSVLRRLQAHDPAHAPSGNNAIQYMLRNPFYKGFVTYGRKTEKPVMAPGLHKAIIDEGTWKAVQVERQRRKEMGRRLPYSVNPLSGLVVCGHCGRLMKTDSGIANPWRMYICRRPGCVRNGYRVDKLEEFVAAQISEWARKPELLAAESERALAKEHQVTANDVAQLRQAIGNRQAALDQWRTDYEDGFIDRDEYYGHRAEITEQLESLEGQLEEKLRLMDRADPGHLLDVFEELMNVTGEDIRAAWREPEYIEYVKALLRRMGMKIEIRDGHAELSVGLL